MKSTNISDKAIIPVIISSINGNISVCADRAVKVTDEKIVEQNNRRKTDIHKCDPQDTHR